MVAKKKPKQPARPSAIEREYSAKLRAMVKDCRAPITAAVARFVAEMRKREDSVVVVDGGAAVTRALAGVKVQIDTVVKKARPGLLAQGVGKRTTAFAVRAADKAVRGVVEIPASKVVKGVDQARFIKGNVSLIKSIPVRLFAEVQDELADAWAKGRATDVLARRIEERFGVAASRADLIARDQVSKLNGQVQRKRFADLGFKSYTWSTSNDERVRGRPDGLYPDARPSHWEREGEAFDFAKPPKDGHPGEAINCRCVAIPIDDLDEEQP